MNGRDAAGSVRRSRRDWVVDTAVFLLAVAWGLYLSGERIALSRLPEPAWLFDLDQVTGAVGCAALWLRRRWPVQLAVALVALSTYSELVSGAMIAAMFTVAIHRPPRVTGAVFGLSLLAALVYVRLRPEPGEPAVLLFLLGATLQGAAVGWGLYVRHRRQLEQARRERVRQAETEARLRAEQAQMQTREQIAREMHDVLGHRLSLLSVQAGALQFRPDAPAEEVARAAEVIRDSAHQALQDLREVIGVLRAPVGELPQPTLAGVRDLVAESGRAGMRVELREELADGNAGGEAAGAVPDRAGRTAYRVVQEALTNARKHAPGARVHVRLAGAAGDGLTVEVVNAAPAPAPEGAAVVTPPAAPGTAQGLVGLAERVALAGGRLEHGAVDGGGWRLRAWLPWPA